MTARMRAFTRLADGVFDVCVIGAGILGSRIAYEATRDGLSVALLDAGDIGGATSSASSKLIHGGLRYFAQGHLGIARASLREKRALVSHVAPGLARPMRIVVSIERRKWAGAIALRGALAVYDALGGWGNSRTRLIAPETARRLVPALSGRPLGPCILLDEAQIDDARLTLATALAAADAGAVVMNHARVTGLALGGDEARLAVRGPEGTLELRARSVVNATGPWLDAVRRLEDPSAAPVARLSKGVHVVVTVDEPWSAALSVHTDDEHNLFAAPWQGMVLIGVTDTEFDADPSSLTATEADIDLLLRLSERVLPAHLLRRERIKARSAGLRVLPLGDGSTATAKRENVVATSARGMVSIGGGKLTTHRLEAMAALQLLPASVRPRRRAPSPATIVGVPRLTPRDDVTPETLEYLAATYGDKVGDVLLYGTSDRSALQRINPEGPDVWAQVRYAIANELAMTVDDVIDRRTSLRWRGLDDEATREQIARVLMPRLVPT